MQEIIKDWFQVVGGTVAIIGGSIAALKAIHEMRENRKQRQIEFCWKRVNAAKELLTDIHKHEFASQAVTMLDWYAAHHEYQLPSGERKVITWQMILDTLGKEQAECESDIEIFIRDCFDWFFYLVDRMEHYISAQLIDRSDVEMAFYSYAHFLDSNWLVFSGFIECHRYILAKRFFEKLTDNRPKVTANTEKPKRVFNKAAIR